MKVDALFYIGFLLGSGSAVAGIFLHNLDIAKFGGIAAIILVIFPSVAWAKRIRHARRQGKPTV